jgi:dTDP-4-dehydrorhamnose reductase
MTRILLVGGSGMLGHRLALELAGRSGLDVHVTVRRPVPEPFRAAGARYHHDVDLGSGTGPIARLLGELAPDVVLNAVGAIKQKDLAADVDQSFFLNGVLPHTLALLNPNPAGRVVHVSTDCVFRGNRGGYRQDEPPDAEDLYGRSKAMGELAYGRHLTLRTSIIGFEVAGFLGLVSWFFRQPPGSRLNGYTAARYSGLTTGELSRTIARLLAAGEMPSGTWHLSSMPITKFELLNRLNVAFGLGHTLAPDDSVQVDRTLDDAPWRRLTGTARPDWSFLVDDLMADWNRRPYAELYAALRPKAGAVRA